MRGQSIFLFAGEKSADLHGEKLVDELHRSFPHSKIYGVGGPKMRGARFECIMPMEKFEVMGFVDVFFAMFRLIKQFLFLRNELLSNPPDVVVFIDYPGFNLALAKSLVKRSFQGKICHYICPSVWAWGKNRISKMEKILDQLFVIFPFEKDLFNQDKLKVSYVGHPLIKQINSNHSLPIDIDPKSRVIAVFPGSREKEISRNFPTQLKVIERLIKKHSDLFIVISVSDPKFSLMLDQILKKERFMGRDRIMLIDSSQNHALMKRATIAIAKSGTNNLELALHRVPTVVTYGIGLSDLLIAKYLLRIRLPHYSIVNIVANDRVFPELIGPNLTEEALFTHADHFLTNPQSLKECREKCLKLGKLLDEKEPEQEIAQALKSLISPAQ